MKRKTLPLCSLGFAASLASCSPVVQTAGRAYQTTVVAGIPLALATRIPATQIADQTPNDRYATFPDCQRAAVLVADVQRLGAEAADVVCRDLQPNIDRTVALSQVSAAVFLVPVLDLPTSSFRRSWGHSVAADFRRPPLPEGIS